MLLQPALLTRRHTTFACTFTAVAVSATDATSYTFSNQAIGTVSDPERSVLVCALGRIASGGTLTINGITVGGKQAYEVVSVLLNNAGVATRAGIWRVDQMEHNATADVVVTFAETSLRCGIAVYRMFNASAAHATDSTSGTAATTLNRTILIPERGVGVYCGTVSAAPTHTWTNATEDTDTATESAATCITSAQRSTAGSTAVTMTADAANGDAVLCCASFGPANN